MTDRSARDRIVDAAAELFAERGYQSTTTRALAERAGVNEVTIFRLFGSKLGVLGGLGERFAVLGAVAQASAEPLPDDLGGAVTELAMREVATASAYGAVAMRLAFDANSVPELAAMMGRGPAANSRAMEAFFEEQQRRGSVRTDIDAAVMADAFFALTSTYVMSRELLPSGSGSKLGHEAAVRQLVKVLLGGICARG